MPAERSKRARGHDNRISCVVVGAVSCVREMGRRKRAGSSPVNARRLWKGGSIFSRATENGPAFCAMFCVHTANVPALLAKRSRALLSWPLSVYKRQVNLAADAGDFENVSCVQTSTQRMCRPSGPEAPARASRWNRSKLSTRSACRRTPPMYADAERAVKSQ